MPTPSSAPLGPVVTEPGDDPVAGPLRPVQRRALQALALLGAALPWVFNLRYFGAGGSVAPQVFWPDAMANALTTAITLDMYLAGASFSVWVWMERRADRAWWRPWGHVAACFGIGLAFALPWYLASRGLRPRPAPTAAAAVPP